MLKNPEAKHIRVKVTDKEEKRPLTTMVQIVDGVPRLDEAIRQWCEYYSVNPGDDVEIIVSPVELDGVSYE